MIEVDSSAYAGLLSLPDGVFIRAEALERGVSDDVLTAGVRRGAIARLCRGGYTRPGPWTNGEHRRLLARVAQRLYPDAVLVGASALAAHGVPLFEIPVEPFDLARPIQREATTAHLRMRPLRHEPVETPWGPAQPVAVALIQTAMDHGIPAGVAAIDHALHTQMVTRDDVEAVFRAMERWPHSSRARCSLHWCDAASESPGESVTRVILRGAGWRVDSQIPIADADGVIFAWADLGIAETPVLIEFDGKVKYTDGGTDALFREKKREDRIRARGYIVVRVTWADLFSPQRIIDAVVAALAVAA